jgi:hypothetical protein
MLTTMFNCSLFVCATGAESPKPADVADYTISSLIACMALVVLILAAFGYSKGRINLAYMLIFVVAGGLDFLLAIGFLIYKILNSKNATDKNAKKTRSIIKLTFMIAMISVIIIAVLMLFLVSQKVIKVNDATNVTRKHIYS